MNRRDVLKVAAGAAAGAMVPAGVLSAAASVPVLDVTPILVMPGKGPTIVSGAVRRFSFPHWVWMRWNGETYFVQIDPWSDGGTVFRGNRCFRVDLYPSNAGRHVPITGDEEAPLLQAAERLLREHLNEVYDAEEKTRNDGGAV